MKNIFILNLSVISLILAGCSTPQDPSIVGKWQCTSNTNEANCEFLADGKMNLYLISSGEIITNCTYMKSHPELKIKPSSGTYNESTGKFTVTDPLSGEDVGLLDMENTPPVTGSWKLLSNSKIIVSIDLSDGPLSFTNHLQQTTVDDLAIGTNKYTRVK